MEQEHRKHTLLFGFLVFGLTFLTYLITVAPTVAFWDCGEYIGASHSLAIPHPPGNPLYVLLGRVFSILFFFFNQVAYRINLISIFAASFTSLFIYLIIVRAMVSWMGTPQEQWERTTIYLSGVVGAFFCAFGYTFWFSSVEASVYIPSMLVVVLCTWLAVVWAQSKDPSRDRLLILFAYVAFLGIGIHMMSMLALIPVFLFVLISDQTKLKDWRLWISCLAMGAVIYNVALFFWLGPITIVITMIMSLMEKKAKKQWRLCFWIAFFALVGYSVHIYIPIRSALNPIIDENHPVVEVDESGSIDWGAFRYFLERKQYGSESMITRMFHRLGAWNKQFGIDGHMGYGGFHLTQFFHFGRSIWTDRNDTVVKNWGMVGGFLRLFLYLIPTMVMLYGWSYLYKRDKKMATLLIFLFLIGSVILVLYMNFADGTRPMKREYEAWVQNGRHGDMPLQHREVRIRDYFFTSGFMFFGMWIGIAFGCILHALFTSKNLFYRKQLAPVLVILFAASPALPFSQNFTENMRRNDWIPYDYAYNLLMSCEKDGILFTNGDNDTFPLWFLQEAEGIRRDVRIVNLSLLNTLWYIRQLKELEPKVPISFTDEYISSRLVLKLNPIEQSVQYKMPKANIPVQLPGRDTKQLLRVQDQMVVNIVDANNWKKPIYFAVTVSNENLMGLRPYLQMQGLVYRCLPHIVSSEKAVNLERTMFLLNKVYRFRGLGDSKVPLSETTLKLVSNYSASFIQVAITLQQKLVKQAGRIEKLELQLKDTTAAKGDPIAVAMQKDLADQKKLYEELEKQYYPIIEEKLNQCIAIMPWNWRVRMLQQQILLDQKKFDEALNKLNEAKALEPNRQEYLQQEARIYYIQGEKVKANAVLEKLAIQEEDPWQAYAMIAKNFEDAGFIDSAIATLHKYQSMHPNDKRASVLISQLMVKKEVLDTTRQDSNTSL